MNSIETLEFHSIPEAEVEMAVRLLLKYHHSLKPSVKHFHCSPASLKIVQFVLSDIGEGIKEVTVKDWLVKEGETVKQFDDVCLVESDKASVNITSRYDGVVKKLHYKVGEIAQVGKPLMDIDTPDDSTDTSSTPVTELNVTQEKPVRTGTSTQTSSGETGTRLASPATAVALPNVEADILKTLATPAVRRIARQYGVTLSEVRGSGKHGRVMKEDILTYLDLEKLQSGLIRVDPVKETEKVVPITGVQRVMVSTMTKSHSIPVFGYCEDIDMTKLIELRESVKQKAKQKGMSVTYMPFFIKAMSKALEQYPIINASVDDNCENLIYHSSHNVGVAMDTKNGLIVPNIKNVQNLSVSQVANELNRIMSGAKKGIINPADLKKGTITISNIGVIGGTTAKPLILPPEVAIVALGRVQKKPVINSKGEIVPQSFLSSSWTADHRIIDGATLARFVSLWKSYVENPLDLLMDV